MSEAAVFVVLWIGLSLVFGFLAVTNRINETVLTASFAFLIGVGLMWLVQSGERNAASRWRDGGQQVAIACGHSTECISWLRVTKSSTGIDLPGEGVWLALCNDTKTRELFGEAVPCHPSSDPGGS